MHTLPPAFLGALRSGDRRQAASSRPVTLNAQKMRRPKPVDTLRGPPGLLVRLWGRDRRIISALVRPALAPAAAQDTDHQGPQGSCSLRLGFLSWWLNDLVVTSWARTGLARDKRTVIRLHHQQITLRARDFTGPRTPPALASPNHHQSAGAALCASLLGDTCLRDT